MSEEVCALFGTPLIYCTDGFLSLGFCLKAVVVTAAGAEVEETNTDLRFVQSIAS